MARVIEEGMVQAGDVVEQINVDHGSTAQKVRKPENPFFSDGCNIET
ncbi:MAG TPA: hypothetical protein VFE47_21750 [Tepidisphaeraceae bacterium]|jgi:MOSC domain-containing protein YiiM|nr:hypothetical protein [Tepidisphaeraceae bacterium]